MTDPTLPGGEPPFRPDFRDQVEQRSAAKRRHRRLAALASSLVALVAIAGGVYATTGNGGHHTKTVDSRPAPTAPPPTAPPSTTTTAPPTTQAQPPPSSAPTGPPPAPPTTAVPGTTGPPPAPAKCTAVDLTASPRDNGAGAMNNSAVIIQLTNHSATTCTLRGFPGLALLDANGNTYTNAARRCGYIPCPTTPITVTLAPGATAHFKTSFGNVRPPQLQPCRQSSSALITPPDTYDQIPVPLHIAPCADFGVGTIQPGPGT